MYVEVVFSYSTAQNRFSRLFCPFLFLWLFGPTTRCHTLEAGAQYPLSTVFFFSSSSYRFCSDLLQKECPHSSFPLSNGTPFDIEDFGVKLSAGITCPKHDWSFDLFTGKSDRGSYRLKVWETEVRKGGAGVGDEDGEGEGDIRKQ